jgi:hypothetical protein
LSGGPTSLGASRLRKALSFGSNGGATTDTHAGTVLGLGAEYVLVRAHRVTVVVGEK